MVGFVNIVIISVVVVESVVIARAAHVAVGGQLQSQGFEGAYRAQVPAALQDRLDALAGGTPEAHGQATGALQAPLAVLTGERQQSEAGSIALLGVGLGTQHVLNDRPGVRADRLAPLDESPWRPLRVRAMRL